MKTMSCPFYIKKFKYMEKKKRKAREEAFLKASRNGKKEEGTIRRVRLPIMSARRLITILLLIKEKSV